MTDSVATNGTTVNPIEEALQQAIAQTIIVAIPAFTQVGMTALLNALQNLVTHHSGQ